MTRRKAIKMLKNEKAIDCLNIGAYLIFLALKIEIGSKYDGELSKLNKAWEGR